MTVRELIGQLMCADNPDAEVTIFAAGEIYPTLVVQTLDGYDDVEIGGGWEPLDGTEHEK